MKWKKVGKIFDPADYGLIFAQSPQTLVFDDFVRVYFSTRKKDKDKYLSHIAFVDFDKSFKKVINISQNTVISLGRLGSFDEHGVFPMNVVRYDNDIYAYTSGWNRKSSVSVDTSIGLAVSNDNGLTFQKLGDGPVLTSSIHEPFLVGDPFVKIINNVFHMWYIYGVSWKFFGSNTQPDRVYKIGHAVSKDGVDWVKDNRQIISDSFHDESQALPTVIYFKNKYHMFFCYRQSSDFRKNSSRAYRIGYACSNDLVNWVRDDEQAGINVTENSWDSDMMCYPHVFSFNDDVYLLYNGNEFGRHGFGLARLEGEI
ncbi:hypothetical protein NLX71_22250 [Paenibacillus sp. MZ04-78.2]|uniref:hypothetical protein n=1 Tax=Paenibacillus sp. MZ04-78.2 TaxID=2962034 RepID=UPI0020B666E1|nr:hypothetical protein [Paenibacillus sp. MZ04-78.2]MCP3775990.1 hypothetical protein [Paenibacillus sp. MZ04-78.2]